MPVTVTEENICNANALFWEQMLAMHVEPVQRTTEAEVRCIGAKHPEA